MERKQRKKEMDERKGGGVSLRGCATWRKLLPGNEGGWTPLSCQQSKKVKSKVRLYYSAL